MEAMNHGLQVFTYVSQPLPLRFLLMILFSVRMNPIKAFELLFFAVFGQTSTDSTQLDKASDTQWTEEEIQIIKDRSWTEVLFKIVFGVYMLVSVIVLINLLIAMMSDTYQRIQVGFLFKYF